MVGGAAMLLSWEDFGGFGLIRQTLQWGKGAEVTKWKS
jgi:hypothetical protein